MSLEENHFHEDLIPKIRRLVKGRIPVKEVLDDQVNLVSRTDREQILRECDNHGDIRATSKLLDVLLRESSEKFVKFVDAIRTLDRSDLAEEIYKRTPQKWKKKFPYFHDPDSDSFKSLDGAVGRLNRLHLSLSDAHLQGGELTPDVGHLQASGLHSLPNLNDLSRVNQGRRGSDPYDHQQNISVTSTCSSNPSVQADSRSPTLDTVLRKQVKSIGNLLTAEDMDSLFDELPCGVFSDSGEKYEFWPLFESLMKKGWTVDQFLDVVKKSLDVNTARQILTILGQPQEEEKVTNAGTNQPAQQFYPAREHQPLTVPQHLSQSGEDSHLNPASGSWAPSLGEPASQQSQQLITDFHGETRSIQPQDDSEGFLVTKTPDMEALRIRQDLSAVAGLSEKTSVMAESDPVNRNAIKCSDIEVQRLREDIQAASRAVPLPSIIQGSVPIEQPPPEVTTAALETPSTHDLSIVALHTNHQGNQYHGNQSLSTESQDGQNRPALNQVSQSLLSHGQVIERLPSIDQDNPNQLTESQDSTNQLCHFQVNQSPPFDDQVNRSLPSDEPSNQRSLTDGQDNQSSDGQVTERLPTNVQDNQILPSDGTDTQTPQTDGQDNRRLQTYGQDNPTLPAGSVMKVKETLQTKNFTPCAADLLQKQDVLSPEEQSTEKSRESENVPFLRETSDEVLDAEEIPSYQSSAEEDFHSTLNTADQLGTEGALSSSSLNTGEPFIYQRKWEMFESLPNSSDSLPSENPLPDGPYNNGNSTTGSQDDIEQT